MVHIMTYDVMNLIQGNYLICIESKYIHLVCQLHQANLVDLGHHLVREVPAVLLDLLDLVVLAAQ